MKFKIINTNGEHLGERDIDMLDEMEALAKEHKVDGVIVLFGDDPKTLVIYDGYWE